MREIPLTRLPPRQEDCHKGNFGNALLIGGSRGMSGAIALAGMAAVRSGAGLVRLAVPDCCLETVAAFSPCSMLVPVPNDEQGRMVSINDHLRYWMSISDCVAIGPGLGRSDEVTHFVCSLIRQMAQDHPLCPLVVDADGLFALANRSLRELNLMNPLVLTPHPGEWARLSGTPAGQRDAQVASAIAKAAEWSCTIVLKGHRTLITNGQQSSLNSTGTSAMATGGSGDVLTGIITALICQGLETAEAARLGVHVHGLAGMMAAEQLGAHVVLPTELIEFLPEAFAKPL